AAAGDRITPRVFAWLNLQLLWKSRKDFTSALGDHDYVFQARATQSRIVQSGLDRQYLSIFQSDFLQPRMLVDLQPEPVAGPVKKSDSPAFAKLRRKTTLREELLNCLVNCHPIQPGLDLSQRQCLAGFHRLPKCSLRVACAPAQNGPSHVPKIPRLRVAWKNIENDQRVRGETTRSALMRIARLVAAGD